jgi:hypothetical protein
VIIGAEINAELERRTGASGSASTVRGTALDEPVRESEVGEQQQPTTLR